MLQENISSVMNLSERDSFLELRSHAELFLIGEY